MKIVEIISAVKMLIEISEWVTSGILSRALIALRNIITKWVTLRFGFSENIKGRLRHRLLIVGIKWGTVIVVDVSIGLAIIVVGVRIGLAKIAPMIRPALTPVHDVPKISIISSWIRHRSRLLTIGHWLPKQIHVEVSLLDMRVAVRVIQINIEV